MSWRVYLNECDVLTYMFRYLIENYFVNKAGQLKLIIVLYTNMLIEETLLTFNFEREENSQEISCLMAANSFVR